MRVSKRNKVIVRQEIPDDFKEVLELIKKAFQAEEFSDHKEHFLVERMRKSSAFIPELSLVAQTENEIVGHILLTKVRISNNLNKFESLALAPVTVLPKYQRNGIGGLLIEHSHKQAKDLGYKSIVLLGHEKYYPKFGYQRANKFGIEFPFDVPKENCLAIELVEDALEEINGTVEYPKEFFE